MGRPRHTKIRDKRDQNHSAIVGYLRVCGFEVIETERPLDCLVWNHDQAGWIEIKADSRNAKIKRGQLEFMAETKMPVAFVKTEDEALEFSLDMNGLTDVQKDSIAQFLIRDDRKEFYPATVEQVLGIKPARRGPKSRSIITKELPTTRRERKGMFQGEK